MHIRTMPIEEDPEWTVPKTITIKGEVSGIFTGIKGFWYSNE